MSAAIYARVLTPQRRGRVSPRAGRATLARVGRALGGNLISGLVGGAPFDVIFVLPVFRIQKFSS